MERWTALRAPCQAALPLSRDTAQDPCPINFCAACDQAYHVGRQSVQVLVQFCLQFLESLLLPPSQLSGCWD